MSKKTLSHTQANAAPAAGKENLLTPDVNMLILTWVTFFLLVAFLYKYAWRPILSALEVREESIRKSVEEAQKIKEELEKINEACEQVLQEAEDKSKEILAQSRKGAVEAAKIIEEKAKEQANILLENARRDIREEVEKAQANLREESVHIAVSLAGKLIAKNLDDEKNQKLLDEFIKEI